jgi:hypothetical protein
MMRKNSDNWMPGNILCIDGDPGFLNAIITGDESSCFSMIRRPKDKVQHGDHTTHQDRKRFVSRNHVSKPCQSHSFIPKGQFIGISFQREGLFITSTTYRYWNVCWKESSMWGQIWNILVAPFAWQHPCSHSDQHKDISGQKRDCSAQSPSLLFWPGSSRLFSVTHIDAEIKRCLIWYDQWDSEERNSRTEYWQYRQVFQVFSKLMWMKAVISVFNLLETIFVETYNKRVALCIVVYILFRSHYFFCCTVYIAGTNSMTPGNYMEK